MSTFVNTFLDFTKFSVHVDVAVVWSPFGSVAVHYVLKINY